MRASKKLGAVTKKYEHGNSSNDAPTGKGQAEEEGQEERPDRHRAHLSRRSTTPSSRSPTSPATSSRGRSAGSRGFKGSRKSTPFAAQLAAEDAAKKAMEHGMRTVAVYVKGPGSGRESALRALQRRGLQVTLIRDVTPDPAQRLPAAQAPPRLIVR